MNSLSNNNNNNGNCYDHCPQPQPPCDPCHDHHKQYFNPCPPKYVECPENVDLHPLPGSALLEKGIGNNPVVNHASVIGIPLSPTNPLVVAQVTIDPTCLCFPTIKVEFSSLLQLTGLAITDSLTIQLNRIIGTSGVKETLQTFTINFSLLLSGTLPFSFVFGDVSANSKPRTYSVEVTGASALAALASIQFNNVDILALAVGGLREC
ncbi:DUF4489 domain-containing protein [Clostridium sp. JN-1]|uniref:DUF4489 domain-containing protein n=1 Tax=Clostridium sp. JN-1 TaxID=2483110 RepID=UPI000F0AF720|nr:DUF4489 domain-containing protein [Clostridium sp. JN-1]